MSSKVDKYYSIDLKVIHRGYLIRIIHRILLKTEPVFYDFWEFLADENVFQRSIAIVMGPTPPGTGVI